MLKLLKVFDHGMTSPSAFSNFSFLRSHDEQFARLGTLAERYFPEDPNDEPAEKLLARIAQQADDLSKTVRAKK